MVALVVARPGRLRDGWRAVLLAMEPIHSVSLAGDTAMATWLAESLDPDLVLVDMEVLGNEAQPWIARMKANLPKGRYLALARNTGQLEEAHSAGTDAALVKGFSAVGFSETVRRLLLGAESGREGTGRT